MRKYSYFAVFRIFTIFMLPVIAVSVLFLRIVGASGYLVWFVFAMMFTALLLCIALFISYKDFFKSEIERDRHSHPIYESKLEEYHLLIETYLKDSEKLRKDIEKTKLQHIEAEKKRQRMEEEFRRLNDKFLNFEQNIRSLFEITTEMLVIVDEKGEILEMNRIFSDYIGFDEIGRNLKELLVLDTYYEKMLGEKIISSPDIKGEVAVLKRKESTAHIRFAKHFIAPNRYLVIATPVEDEVSGKSALLMQNREIDYINKINLSLTINKGTNEMLSNIAKSVQELFQISNIAIAKEEDGEWSILQKEGDCDEVQPLQMLEFYNDEQIQLTECSPGQKVVIAKLYSAPNSRIVMMLATDQGINNDDLIIIKMFCNQATIVIQRSQSYEQLKKLFFNTIISLVDVIEAKDKYTEGHSMRVAYYSVQLAKKLGMSEDEIEKIEIAGVLHDVGKVSISQEILQKKGRLTDEEFEMIKTHPWNGYKIIENISFDERIKHGVAYHHVRYDLGGYPADHGLTKLPDFAALIAIADAFDAMTSKRSYSNEKTVAQAIREFELGRGTHFHPEMVDAMIEMCNERDIISEAHYMNINEAGTFSRMKAKVQAMDEEAWRKVGAYDFRKK